MSNRRVKGIVRVVPKSHYWLVTVQLETNDTPTIEVYCSECDLHLNTVSNNVYNAYKKIKSLAQEQDKVLKELLKKEKEAGLKLKKLLA